MGVKGNEKHGWRHQPKLFSNNGMQWIFVGVSLGIYMYQTSTVIKSMNAAVSDSKTPAFFSEIEGHLTTPHPRKSVLPKRLITVFGAESSGSTLLATTLGIASGAFPRNGMNVIAYVTQNSTGREVHENFLAKRARSPDGVIEIQHLSLPWGYWGSKKKNCDLSDRTITVEALVPEPCFRFEHEATWKHRLEVRAPAGCRDGAHISGNSESSGWTCGTVNCGLGENDGYALYPKRFFVNITSHLEWYLKRGVDVTAVLSVRDRSISRAGKETMHCNNKTIATLDMEKANAIMSSALRNFGKKSSEERAIVVSYEGLMSLGGSYLFDIYSKLGINSTHVPDFKDGNAKYVKPNQSEALIY